MAKGKKRGGSGRTKQALLGRALASPLVQAIVRDLVKTAVTAVVAGAIKRRRDRAKSRPREGG